METFVVITDEESTHRRVATCSERDNRQRIDDRHVHKKFLRSVIQHAAHRRIRTAHDAFHPVNRTKIMTAINALRAASAHQHVLVVIRHADDFMGHDLADGKNQIEPATHNESVDLSWPFVVELSFGLFVEELLWNDADGFHIFTPFVYAEKGSGNLAEHGRKLHWRHGAVRSDGGQNCLQRWAIILPRMARQFASP